MATKQEFDGRGFYEALERAVRSRGITWKQLSTDTGVSQTTLTRMGQGRLPDAAGLVALSVWAGLNIPDYVPSHSAPQTGDQTLDKVAVLFRQDSTLSAEARHTLVKIVESAYDALKRAPENGTRKK